MRPRCCAPLVTLFVVGLACGNPDGDPDAPGAGSAETNFAAEGITASYDVVVVGAGTGGVMAAIQASRMGANVALLERTDWIGGQIAAGVGGIDDYHEQWPQTNTGLEKEFADAVKTYYQSEAPFAPKAINTGGLGSWPRNMEPSVAQLLMRRMLDDASVDLHTGVEVQSVMKSENVVTGVALEDDRRFAAKVVIDATEHGDVIPLTGARYYVGKDRSDQVNPQTCVQDLTYTAVIRKYPGPLPAGFFISDKPPGYDAVVARFRQLVQKNGHDSWRPFPWSWVTHNAYRGFPDSKNPQSYTGKKPDWPKITRTDVNFANDYPGNGYLGIFAPELKVSYLTDAAARRQVDCEAKLITLNFLYYVQHEVGEAAWSLADDEGYDTDFNRQHNRCDNIPSELRELEAHLPQQPYVRESMRIVPISILTAAQIRRTKIEEDALSTSIAVGSYNTDLHNCRAAGDFDFGDTDGDRSAKSPFQVPFEALIPETVDGFVAAEKNIGVSRLANGATRLHGITMATGQAAGAIAALAVEKGVQPRQLRVIDVQWALAQSGSALALRHFNDVPLTHRFWKFVQLASVRGVLNGYNPSSFGVEDPLTRAQAAVVMARLLDLDIDNPPAEPRFDDVPASHWARGSVEALREAGITNGCGGTAYCPDQPITRAQLAAFVARGLGLSAQSTDPLFDDVPAGAQFYSVIQAVADAEIMTGCASAPRRFCPDVPATRGQAAVVAARVLLR